MFAAGLDNIGHRLGRSAYHGQLDWGSNVFYRGIGTLALHFLMRRIDRIEDAGVPTLPYVPEDDLAHCIGTLAGTEDGY
jgi:hypothetical protein